MSVNTCEAGALPAVSGWQTLSLRSTDIDEHAAGLQRWQQRYDQLSPGGFDGRLDQALTESAQVYRERTNQALRQHCEVWSDAVWCGITVAHDGSRIEGRVVGEAGVMVCGQAAQFELISPAGHDLLGIVVSRKALHAHADVLGEPLCWSLIDRAPWLQVTPQRREHAKARLRAILALSAGGAPQTRQRTSAACDSLRLAMLDVLTDLFESPNVPHEERSNAASRRRVVQRVHDWVLANPDEVPSVPQLCAQLCVSRRTLQYAFEAAVGIGPKAYLRCIRLNGVRRMLSRGRAGAVTVQDAAASWGFWSLSQFAADYRRMFGQRPSETLSGHCGEGAATRRRAEIAMPAAISAKATPWYQVGHSPSSAADISAANSGVRLTKKAAIAGPASATPWPQQR